MSWYLIVQMFKKSNYKDLPALFSFALFLHVAVLHVIKFEWKMKEKRECVTLNHIVMQGMDSMEAFEAWHVRLSISPFLRPSVFPLPTTGIHYSS